MNTTTFDPENRAVAWGSQSVNQLCLRAFLRDNFSSSDERIAVKMCARWALDIECELLHSIIADVREKLVEAHQRNSLEPIDAHLNDLHRLLRNYQTAYKALPAATTDRWPNRASLQ